MISNDSDMWPSDEEIEDAAFESAEFDLSPVNQFIEGVRWLKARMSKGSHDQG